METLKSIIPCKKTKTNIFPTKITLVFAEKMNGSLQFKLYAPPN